MIVPLFRRNRQQSTIDRLYGAIVAQARSPAFYTAYSVPDTVEGRLDMLILHAVLLLHRTNGDNTLRRVGQAVFDRFCQDMDDNLREMGVGDLAVPRQMRRIGGAFYGRAKVYRAALAAADDPSRLVDALRRNIYSDGMTAEPSARRLATYVWDAVAHLQRQDATALAAGLLTYPEPSVAAEAAPTR